MSQNNAHGEDAAPRKRRIEFVFAREKKEKVSASEKGAEKPPRKKRVELVFAGREKGDAAAREERIKKPRKKRVELVFAGREKGDAAAREEQINKPRKKRVEFVSARSEEKKRLAAQPVSRAQQRRMAQRRRQVHLSFALLALIVLLLGLCGWQYAEYRDFQTMRSAVDIATFYDGTYVEGIDVSDMTLEQAKEYWAENIEPQYSQVSVALSDGTEVTAEMVGYSSNYEDVLQAAFRAVREGGLEQRYEALGNMTGGMDYVVSRTLYTQEGVEAYVEHMAGLIDCEPTTPAMSHFDTDQLKFVYADGAPGLTLNQDALREDLLSAFSQGGGGEVTLDIAEEEPAIPTDEYGMIAIYITSADNSSSARLNNIRLALKTINGTKLEPGQMFSFNGVVGERTKEAGYREAKAYYGMRDILEVGGGICQVSSTLYASVLVAKLEVVERHEHGRRVYYIPSGWDATVDWGHKDLKFINNRDETIYFGCRMDDSDNCYVAIYGKLEEGDYGLSEQGRAMASSWLALEQSA